MFQPGFTGARFLRMTRHRCHCCGRPAFAYRLEPDGTKTYLCEKHIPTDETSCPGISSGPVFLKLKDDPA
jgi:hypothetical protein